MEGSDPVFLRPYKSEDAATLAEVMRDAIQGSGSSGYTPAQLNVWSRYPEDLEEFREKLSRGVTLVAESAGQPVAFGQLDPSDHVEFLYCRTAYARRGIASIIYRELEAHALAAGALWIQTEASRVSRLFFEKFEYKVDARESVERYGEVLERFRMLRLLIDLSAP